MKTFCTLVLYAAFLVNAGFILVFFACLIEIPDFPRWYYVFWRRADRWWKDNQTALLHRVLLLLGLISFILLFNWLDSMGLNNVNP